MLELQFVTSKLSFNKSDVELLDKEEFIAKLFPVVYILFDETAMCAYIGESTNAKARLTTHLSHIDKSKLKKAYIVSSPLFNKSAALDIESYLIQSMPSLGFNLLNGNAGIANHNYYQKDLYSTLFKNIWSELTFDNVEPKSLLEIKNSDIFKYSPYKTLTQDQFNSSIEILENITTKKKVTTFVNGLAGTGKTILAIYLIKILSDYRSYDNDEFTELDDSLQTAITKLKSNYPDSLSIGFVVPMTSLRNTLKSVFGKVHGLSKKMVIGPSDVVKQKYDLLIVDEAHRLTRRVSITNYRDFDNANKKLGLDNSGTQLDWILKSSKHQVLFYDSEQSIKPADVRKEDFDYIKTLSTSTEIQLVSQLRSKGGKDYISFVDELLNNRLPINHKKFSSTDYELVMFTSMDDMVEQLRKRESEHGLSRMMSGYSWKWVSRANENTPDTVIDGVGLTWNRVSKDWINSTTDATEMGCIHTVQGYDLNFAGVIFGEEITFDKKMKLITVNKEKYFDAKGKAAIRSPEELHNYIIKIYKTMMYRGIKGTYIYACDEGLRDYFSKTIMTKG